MELPQGTAVLLVPGGIPHPRGKPCVHEAAGLLSPLPRPLLSTVLPPVSELPLNGILPSLSFVSGFFHPTRCFRGPSDLPCVFMPCSCVWLSVPWMSFGGRRVRSTL